MLLAMSEEHLTILPGKASELRNNGGDFSIDFSRIKPWYLDCGCRFLSWKQVVWRIVNGLMAMLFGAAAVLQWNDSDTHAWTTVYVIPCLLSLSVAIWIRIQDFIAWKIIVALHLSGCLGGMIYLSITYGDKISAASPDITSIEEGWELSGLLFVVLWLAVTLIVASYRSCWLCFLRQTDKLPSRIRFKPRGNFDPEPIE